MGLAIRDIDFTTLKNWVFYSRDVMFNETRPIVEWRKLRMTEKKHTVVEIECQNTNESEDDNLEEEITKPRKLKRMEKPPDQYGE